VTVKVFVEGGGDTNFLRGQCREAFSTFLRSAGISVLPKIVAKGGRSEAYRAYRIAVENGERAMLLIDSEDPVAQEHQSGNPTEWKPWTHLKKRDNWDKPENANDRDCHLMVQEMEAWLIADRDALIRYFGVDFDAKRLPPPTRSVETLPKHDINRSLSDAARKTKKNGYDKGRDAFKILQRLDAKKVMQEAAWARRFVDRIREALTEGSTWN
jgi:hypothetical protein